MPQNALDFAALYANEVAAHMATRKKIRSAQYWVEQIRVAALDGRADLCVEYVEVLAGRLL